MKAVLESAGLAYTERHLGPLQYGTCAEARALVRDMTTFAWLGGNIDHLPWLAILDRRGDVESLAKGWTWSKLKAPAASWIPEVRDCLGKRVDP